MIVDQHLSREVYTSGKNESSFTADMSGAAFMAISDDVYQHKVAAIVRELSCNAYDSHLEAGKKDVPFTIHLPTLFTPIFYIQDYGIGLDDEGIRNVFTVYFKSLKKESEDAIGFYGLGAKTPFAYTDNFNIIARKDGIERQYLAFFGEDSIPRIKLLSEKKTDACNGVKISFSVKTEDVEKFTAEASFILSFMPTMPEVLGNENFKLLIPDVQEQLEKKNFVSVPTYTESTLYNLHGSYILMGHVCYPVNIVNRQFYTSGQSVAIPVKNGTFKPALSRESLSLRNGTLDEINALFTQRSKEYKAQIQEGINAQSTFKDAILYAKEIGINPIFFNVFKYKKRPLNDLLENKNFQQAAYRAGRGLSIREGTEHYSNIATRPVRLYVNDEGISRSLFRKAVRSHVEKNYKKEGLDFVYDVKGVSDLRIKRASALLLDNSTVFRVSDIRETVNRERNFQKKNLKEKTKQTVYASVVGKYNTSKANNIEIVEGTKYYEVTRKEHDEYALILQMTIRFLEKQNIPVKLLVKKETKKHSFPSFWEIYKNEAKDFIETVFYLHKFFKKSSITFNFIGGSYVPSIRNIATYGPYSSDVMKMDVFKEESNIISVVADKLNWLNSFGVQYGDINCCFYWRNTDFFLSKEKASQYTLMAQEQSDSIDSKIQTINKYLADEVFILNCIDEYLTKQADPVKLAA